MSPEEEHTYLGLDLSTQQLKGIVVNKQLDILHETLVQFDTDLPEFRTHHGVIRSTDKRTVTSPVIMWIKALDMLLDRLRVCGADFAKVAALSGSAQQHGTVFWSVGAEEILKSLDEVQFLHTQLASCFSVQYSPVWIDSSTKDQCEHIEKELGGPENLAKITGSRAYERYSGAQIRKIFETKQLAYKNTERISLISSFACSLILGKYAPIDWSDASGMNLFDIENKVWSHKCLEACAPDLEEKLGSAVPSRTVLGKISNYFVERFGFNENCSVIAFTGDNPSSLAGVSLKDTDIAISLGTSDTLFLNVSEPKIFHDGHILINPINQNRYMVLLCFKNGSLTRERIRDEFGERSWEEFSKLLENTPRGNFGYIGLYFDNQEIIPSLQGDFRFDKTGRLILKFPSPEIEVRALIEGQFIAKRAHLRSLGLVKGESFNRIIATGGGSKNKSILQVLSDVFNAPVYTFDSSNSAVLGAAFRSIQEVSNVDSDDILVPNSFLPELACEPFKDAEQVYEPLIERYLKIIETLGAT